MRVSGSGQPGKRNCRKLKRKRNGTGDKNTIRSGGSNGWNRRCHRRVDQGDEDQDRRNLMWTFRLGQQGTNFKRSPRRDTSRFLTWRTGRENNGNWDRRVGDPPSNKLRKSPKTWNYVRDLLREEEMFRGREKGNCKRQTEPRRRPWRIPFGKGIVQD